MNSLTKQTVEDAVEQYRRDRDPREKLFEFGRCGVHFAVDDAEVRMSTELRGKGSWFLPLNKGWNDGAGNPPNPAGLKTDYLWKEILTPAPPILCSAITRFWKWSTMNQEPRATAGEKRRNAVTCSPPCKRRLRLGQERMSVECLTQRAPTVDDRRASAADDGDKLNGVVREPNENTKSEKPALRGPPWGSVYHGVTMEAAVNRDFQTREMLSRAGPMGSPAVPPQYSPVLVPALQRIQHEFGYLKREALEQFSRESGVPLYRLQAVASFFPHFQLSPPSAVVLRVCRDMACHMAGSATMLRDLESLSGAQVSVQGVSCMGRCDRAPAACVSLKDSEHELFYLARSGDELKEIVTAGLKGTPPKSDRDADLALLSASWLIDPYAGKPSEYAVVRKAIAARDASLDAVAKTLTAKLGWTPWRTEQFRVAAVRQLHVDFSLDAEVIEAVRCWQTENHEEEGAEKRGWSEDLLKEIDDADLRGMGGAGIPAIQKWRDVRNAVRMARSRQADDRAFIVVNGDESEPGTFKDRELLLRFPHLIVESVILAGLITEGTQGFIYIRHEYAEQIEACRAEIQRAEQLGLCGENASVLGRPFPISVFISPGGYICGEQSALIEAMSDRRGEPRNMPPKLETNGLEDLPTLVSNVETFAWVPYICLNGGKAYADQGVNDWHGRRIFSVSGDVKRPGVYEVPMGLTLRDLIYGEQYCQGIAGDLTLKGLAPSGPSGGFLPAKLTVGGGLPRDHTNNKAWQALASRRGFDPMSTELDILDLELELNLFRALSPTQALGAGLVVYAEGRDMAEQAVNSMEFFRNESCGKCVPCRLGSQKLVSLGAHLMSGQISADRWKDELMPLVREMGKAIELASICGLGRSVPVPLRTVATFFGDDVAKHLLVSEDKPCP